MESVTSLLSKLQKTQSKHGSGTLIAVGDNKECFTKGVTITVIIGRDEIGPAKFVAFGLTETEQTLNVEKAEELLSTVQTKHGNLQICVWANGMLEMEAGCAIIYLEDTSTAFIIQPKHTIPG